MNLLIIFQVFDNGIISTLITPDSSEPSGYFKQVLELYLYNNTVLLLFVLY